MKRKPKILILCPDIPYPEKGGGQVRMTSLILALAKLTDVKIACLSPKVPVETSKWADQHRLAIQNHAPQSASFWKDFRRRLSIVMLVSSNLRFQPDEKLFFERIYQQYVPDLIWVETPYLLRYSLKWQSHVPVIVDYWGTSEGARRVFQHARGLKKIKAWLYWRAARRGEMRYAPKIGNIVCVSDLDAMYFKTIAAGNSVNVIPIGVQSKCGPYHTYEKNQEGQATMIFTGDMSFYPNVDAALYFVNKILPRIQKRFPGAKIRLAGRNPDPRIEALSEIEGVEVTGFITDLGQAIAQSAFYVLPMRLGSGFRTKLLDVFAVGKALVTTPTGAEGLNLKHNRNCLMADAAEDFANACIELLENDALRMRFGTEVKRLALEDYAQETIQRVVQRTIEGAIADKPVELRNIENQRR